MAATRGDEKNGQGEEELSRGASSSKGLSSVNRFLLFLLVLGLGACSGYTLFYVLYMGRCAAMMQEVQTASSKQWSSKYDRLMEEKNQCQADTSVKDELVELQGRLEAQAALAERHQDLLIKTEDTAKELARMQGLVRQLQNSLKTSQDAEREANEKVKQAKLGADSRQQEMERLQEVVRNLQQNLDIAKATERTLNAKVQRSEDMLASRIHELERLSQDKQECVGLQSRLDFLQSHVTLRNERLGRMEFGKGPFYMQFTLQPPSEEPSVVEVTIESLSSLPHTIYTFLTLADLQLYDGTSIQIADDRFIQGGAPESAVGSPQLVKLLERYDKFGLDASSPVVFLEPPQPPDALSFCLVDAGPSFAFHMMDNRGDNELRDRARCLGKVTHGEDVLRKIQAFPRKTESIELEEAVQILSVRLNRTPRKSAAE